jgi:hypothetical protein
VENWRKRLHRVLRDLPEALVDYKGMVRYRQTALDYLAKFDDGAPATRGTAPGQDVLLPASGIESLSVQS